MNVYSERVLPDGCSLALPAELATFCLRAILPRALGVPFWKSIAFFCLLNEYFLRKKIAIKSMYLIIHYSNSSFTFMVETVYGDVNKNDLIGSCI